MTDPVARIKAGTELHVREIRRQASDSESALVLVAEPTVEIEPVDDGQYRVLIHGWHQWVRCLLWSGSAGSSWRSARYGGRIMRAVTALP